MSLISVISSKAPLTIVEASFEEFLQIHYPNIEEEDDDDILQILYLQAWYEFNKYCGELCKTSEKSNV